MATSRRLLIVIGLCGLVAGTIACATVQTKLYDQAMQRQRQESGLSIEKVRVLDHDMPFIERGEGPTVLLLHGFGANKDTWMGPFLDGFKTRFHVVVPDLPGFGDATYRANEHYTVDKQVERLVAFMDAQEIDTAHVIGNSMGGLFAIALAAKVPERVRSLSLLAPAGIPGNEKSEFQLMLERGEPNPLVVRDEASLDKMMGLAFVNPPELPAMAKPILINEYVKREAQHTAIFDEMVAAGIDGMAYLPHITAPVLIIWGDADKILHPSGADPLAAALPGSKKVILKNCGHVPQAEKPNQTSAEVLKFLLAIEEAKPASEETPAPPAETPTPAAVNPEAPTPAAGASS